MSHMCQVVTSKYQCYGHFVIQELTVFLQSVIFCISFLAFCLQEKNLQLQLVRLQLMHVIKVSYRS